MELKIVKGVLKKYTPGDETELTVPAEVTAIGARAFKGCKTLTTITLPEGLQEIGDYAFRDCTALRELHIPAGAQTIGTGICRGCTSLESVTLPALSMIPDHAFQECKALAAVQLPETVTVIGEGAFGNCRALTELYLPDNVKHIGTDAFKECRSLAEIRFPEELETVGNNAFEGTAWRKTQKTQLVLAGAHIVCKCDPDAEQIVVPEGVHTIADCAFLQCEKLQSITFPSTLRHIGTGAFTRCLELTEVTLPDGLETIEERAFCACTSLAKIHIPASVKRIGYSAFSSTPWLQAQRRSACVIAGDGILLRYNANDATDLRLPEGIRAIGPNVFEGRKLTSVTIPEGVEVIGVFAFGQCSDLSEVHFPQSLTTIESAAFNECRKLRKIYLPDNVQRIGEFAFAYAYGLKEVSLPGKIKRIGGAAFPAGAKLRFRMQDAVIPVKLQKDWSLAAGGFFNFDKGCGKNEQAWLDFLAAEELSEREALFEQLTDATFRRAAALYMCHFHPESQPIRDYVKRTVKRLAEDCIKEQDPTSLAALLAVEPLKAKDIDPLIEKAIASGVPELQSILLSHKNGENLYADPFAAFSL